MFLVVFLSNAVLGIRSRDRAGLCDVVNTCRAKCNGVWLHKPNDPSVHNDNGLRRVIAYLLGHSFRN
ncbi:hypothetical protein KC19_VG154900 [Ceratodon purpureus]|uniref:Secreted protein n=1 Tax=Ceratodon purpureus TaxID=3225 RepID=A0A8T0HQQ1_CERPU|nr:hypothetical protein KC19_VG154900 [Ceratodon purpureus]